MESGDASTDTDHETTAAPAEDETDAPAQDLTDYERKIAEIIADAYILKGEYVLALEAMYSEAEAALSSLSDGENNDAAVAALVSDYLSRASSLERQCDSRIDTIVFELEQLIRAHGGDSQLVDTLIETYANEKATKKAWYISRLEEKGLISS